MAQHTVGLPQQGVTDKRRANAGSAAIPGGSVTVPANYDSHDALDSALTAFSATTYTQKRLDTMTLNDKIFALRHASDSGGM